MASINAKYNVEFALSNSKGASGSFFVTDPHAECQGGVMNHAQTQTLYNNLFRGLVAS